jgi:hypothetical protein
MLWQEALTSRGRRRRGTPVRKRLDREEGKGRKQGACMEAVKEGGKRVGAQNLVEKGRGHKGITVPVRRGKGSHSSGKLHSSHIKVILPDNEL